MSSPPRRCDSDRDAVVAGLAARLEGVIGQGHGDDRIGRPYGRSSMKAGPSRAVEPPGVRRVVRRAVTLGYESRLRQRDAPALAVMRELAGQYPRYGYRKIRVFLARRGHPMSGCFRHQVLVKRA